MCDVLGWGIAGVGQERRGGITAGFSWHRQRVLSDEAGDEQERLWRDNRWLSWHRQRVLSYERVSPSRPSRSTAGADGLMEYYPYGSLKSIHPTTSTMTELECHQLTDVLRKEQA